MKVRTKFKKMFKEELDDPNESFMYFLLSLIPEDKLRYIINEGTKIFYNNLKKY